MTLNDFCNENIFLATTNSYYLLDKQEIDKLCENLLYRNSLINQELEVLFHEVKNLDETVYMKESDDLFNSCVKNSIIDHDFIIRILWHRIYDEPQVMKFISMRHSNFANNSYLRKMFPNNEVNDSFEYEYAIMHLI